MTVPFTVIVPTYRRPGQLLKCLDGLAAQTRPALQVIAVHRADDALTLDALRAYSPPPSLALETAISPAPGVVAALNSGLACARGDFVAMTDDDAIPHPDWLQRLHATFADHPEAGGVGGRDILTLPDNPPPAPLTDKVGRTTWYGRSYGNFHCGAGPARSVESLKGVNMAYRRAAIGNLRFDGRLLGSGAQVFNEALFSGAIRKAGWTLIYDPAIRVEHIVAPRPEGEERNRIDADVVRQATHNRTLGLLEYETPWRAARSVGYMLLVGSWNVPGVLAALRGSLRGRQRQWYGLREVWRGTVDGWRTWRGTRRLDRQAREAAPRAAHSGSK